MRSPVELRSEALPALDVRSAVLRERANALPSLRVCGLVRGGLDPERVVGTHASVRWTLPGGCVRTFAGVCAGVEVLEGHRTVAEGPLGGSRVDTVRVELAPWFWVATRTSDHRIFQRQSELDVARKILDEYAVPIAARLTGEHPIRELRVQYGESDHDFVARMLEQAGVGCWWKDDTLELDDAPCARPPSRALPFHDRPARGSLHATRVQLRRSVRPGRYAIRDHDLRVGSDVDLWATASGGGPLEQKLERAHYRPGAFVIEVEPPGDTPAADDRGAYRTKIAEGQALAARRLAAKRTGAVVLSFETTAYDVRVGDVLKITGHPDSTVRDEAWLVTELDLAAMHDEDAVLRCEAVPTSEPWRPALRMPRPSVAGVQVATVVGPSGEEIHTDEHGRIRVLFRWDRENEANETASPWLHVNQPWAGSGFGGVNLPRVGQQVFVNFEGGDPDRPYVVGRVYSAQQRVPYDLPASKTQSGWRSSSTGQTGGYNQIQLEDAADGEKLDFRAERDRTVTVLRNDVATIHGNRGIRVGAHDSLEVTGQRYVRVGKDKQTAVATAFSTSAAQEWSYQVEDGTLSLQGSQITMGAPTLRFQGGWASLSAPEVLIRCGSSSIKLSGGTILVDSPEVEINVRRPGLVPIPPDHPDLQHLLVAEARGGRGGGRGGGGREKQRAPEVEVREDAPRREVDHSTEPRPFAEPDGRIDTRGDLSQPASEPWIELPTPSLPEPPLGSVPVTGPLVTDGWVPRPSGGLEQFASPEGWFSAPPEDLARHLGVTRERLAEMAAAAGDEASAAGMPPELQEMLRNLGAPKGGEP